MGVKEILKLELHCIVNAMQFTLPILVLVLSQLQRLLAYTYNQHDIKADSLIELDRVKIGEDCFPSLSKNITIPDKNGKGDRQKKWWCDEKEEYAFLGFSYSINSCPNQDTMRNDFMKMRNLFSSRYVRIYSACDEEGFNNRLVEVAADVGLGIYALIWFGFNGDDKWKHRKADLIQTIKKNKRAPYVIRTIALGSEPLFDSVLPVQEIVSEIHSLKTEVSDYGIQISLSEMAYGFQKNNNAAELFEAIDILEINVLPFFASDATTGNNAWGNIVDALNYFKEHGNGKLIRMTQTGWPSNDSVWKANSANAESSVKSEQEYYDLLDQKCSYFKKESIGWFAHIWSDEELPGWGIVNSDGQLKIKFDPQISC